MKNNIHGTRFGLAAFCVLFSSSMFAQNVEIPDDQQLFMSIITSHARGYENAANDILKSRARQARKAELAESFTSTEFEGWVGTLDTLGTTGAGDAYVYVILSGASNIRLQTTNNSFSESLSPNKTLIKEGSPVYEQLIQLSEGETVVVSGNFFTDEDDHFSDLRLTEQGAMVDPSFLIRVNSISRYGE